MKRTLIHFHWIPEFYFILLGILWFYLSYQPAPDQANENLNFAAIIMIVVFQIQLFLNDRMLGKALSVLVTLGSIAVCMYLVSQILAGNSGKIFSHSDLLLAGNLLILNCIMAYFQFRRYDAKRENQEQVIE